MNEIFGARFESPIGTLRIRADSRGVISIDFTEDADRGTRALVPPAGPAHLAECLRQLGEYFEGRRTAFDVPLSLKGTPFQRRVWAALLDIPFGRTSTYGRIAASLGRPQAGRAVGGANHRNPVSIIVPCHRVVGNDGRLVGYGGGLWRKEWLLAHERRHSRPDAVSRSGKGTGRSNA
jgi:methylated-DNA-[protein]-cysteine S-methyltransferase